jgi:adenosylmethionine-8-amino-7-oxononanoate aminotransferase
MPMAITVTTQKIYDAFYADYNEGKAFLHSHTYCGNPLACAAAVEVLKIFDEENILQTAKNNAEYFANLVREKFSGHKNVGEIRSIGLVNAIELTGVDPKIRVSYKIYREAIKNGLLLRPLGDILYFNPPLTITRNEMKSVVDIAGNAFVTIIEKLRHS